MAKGKVGRARPRRKLPVRPAVVRRVEVTGATDGRHRRGEATRRRLYEAMLLMMRELHDIPATADVAARANVGLRTFYEHFADATTFYAATFDYVIASTLATMPPVSPDGPLAERVAGFVERRSRVCEAWAPMWRVAIRFASHDEGFRLRIARVAQLLRARAQILYAPELATLPAGAQAFLLDAVMSLTEMDAWLHLRDQCGRDVAAAQAVWRYSVAALFARAGRIALDPAST